MILIISNSLDNSTTFVEEWLCYYGIKVAVLSDFNRINNIVYELNEIGNIDFYVKLNDGENFHSNEIRSIWYRQGTIWYQGEFPQSEDQLSKVIGGHIENEWLTLKESIISELEKKPFIGNYFNRIPNKLKTLQVAASVGWKIPDTLITDNRLSVINHFEKKRIVNKNIQDGLSINDETTIMHQRTNEIKPEELPEIFFPSLFQERIDKKYELRVFYLNKKCYGMAIFSQQNEKTANDFREYDYQHMNRYVPYKLTSEAENNLILFMDKMELNTGSIDIVVDKKGNFIFLEVNPHGQFGFVSAACNYNLYKTTALELINLDKNGNKND